MSTVLFVCRQNAGRSQMSQALFEAAAQGRHEALSAGTTPAGQVHPEVSQVMQEIGVDISGRTPRMLTLELAEQADLVITMGCGDQCPLVLAKRRLDWQIPDPRDMSPDEFRSIRNLIEKKFQELIESL